MTQGTNLGSIYYTVDARATAILKAEALINKSLDSVVRDFAKADKAVSEFTAKQAALGRTINSSGQVFSKSGKVIASASIQYRELANAADTARNSAMQMNTGFTKTAKGVSAGMKGMQQGAQNFSYQIQDIAVQLAGGQNPFLIMAQQLPQMLVGLGAAAAGIGALVAILGGLAMVAFDTRTDIEKLESTIDSITASITLSSTGVAEYTEEMKKLRAVSKDLSESKRALLIVEQSDSMKLAAKALSEATEDARGSFQTVEKFTSSLFKNMTSEGAAAFRELDSALGSIKYGATEEGIKRIDVALKAATGSGLGTTEAGKKLVVGLVDLLSKYMQGKATLDELTKAFDDNKEATTKSKESIDAMIESLKLESETTGASSRAKALHIAWLQKATQEQYNSINAYFNAIEAQERKTESDKKATEAAKNAAAESKKNADGIAAVVMSLEDQRKALELTADGYEEYALRKKLAANGASEAVIQENIKELRSIQDLRKETELFDSIDKEDEDKRISVTKETETIAREGADPLTKLTEERDRQLAVVAEYEALETANHQTAVEARAAIDRQYEEQKQLAAEQSFAMQSETNKMLIDGLNSLSGTASSVLTGMVTQTLSAKDAMRALANAVLNDAVESLVQVGIQYVKNALIKQTADKAMLASEVATKAAKATAHTTAVAATVAELSSIAAAAAFASTAAIPIIGPGLAPAAAAAAAGATATLGSAAIAAAPIAGARRYGGAVGYGSNYEVAEGGKAELYIPQRGNPMLMGSKGGQVVSNSDLMSAMNGGGGQANIDIQIINQGTPQEVTNQQQGFDESTGRQFLKLWVADFGNKGQTFRAVTSGTDAKGRTF